MKIGQNGTYTNYVAQGDGRPVILIHGMAASLHDWVYLMPALTEAGYRAYALDLLGHGESAKPAEPEKYHFDTLYAHLAHWIDKLSLEQPALLIGHSLGGYLSLKYALDRAADVNALVLVDPFYHPDQLSPTVRLLNRRPALGAQALQMAPEWLIHFLAGWEPNSKICFSRRTRMQIAADYKRASPHILHIPATVPDLSAGLQSLETTTLVVWGEKDITLHPDTFAALVEILPNAQGQPIPKCGHQPHLGMPQAFNQMVLDFLARLPV